MIDLKFLLLVTRVQGHFSAKFEISTVFHFFEFVGMRRTDGRTDGVQRLTCPSMDGHIHNMLT